MFVYSNRIKMLAGTYDFQFQFLCLSPINNEEGIEEVINGEEATIIMSPQHAKAFSKLLLSQIEEYEKKFGQIVDPIEILSKDTE